MALSSRLNDSDTRPNLAQGTKRAPLVAGKSLEVGVGSFDWIWYYWACCVLLLPCQMKAVAWEVFAELPGSSNLRSAASVKGNLPEPAALPGPHSRHPCSCTSSRTYMWSAALGECGAFSQCSSCCLWHSTSHPILQEPGTVQICLLRGWGREQVVKGVTLSCIERPRHPPSPEDRSCLCHLILKSLTQGRTKSTL